MFDSASPYLAYRCDIGVPAPSCCWFPHAVQSHCGHLVLSTQTSSHCRQIVGLPSPQAGGCHAPGSQSPLPAAGGAPGRSLPFTPAPSIIPHSPTQSLSRPRSLSGEQRCFSAQCFHGAVSWSYVLSLLENALHSAGDKNQCEKELTGMRPMGSDVSFSPARLSHGVVSETPPPSLLPLPPLPAPSSLQGHLCLLLLPSILRLSFSSGSCCN